MFRALASPAFAPFGKLNLHFPEVDTKPENLAEVHMLTGVNGTGKTRVLAALAALLSGPAALQRRLNESQEVLQLYATDDASIAQRSNPDRADWISLRVGMQEFEWPTGPIGTNTRIRNWASKPAFAYHGMAYVADAPVSPIGGTSKPERSSCLRFKRAETHSQQLLQSIAQLKIRALLESQRAKGSAETPSAILLSKVEKTIGEVTGRVFRLELTANPQLVVLAKWGETAALPFNLLPDGLRSIIGWVVDAVVMVNAWQEGKGGVTDADAIFLLDEPESHLHPIWQRRILPAFQRLFPNSQIFVATHSPFVIASLNHGWIHQFTLSTNGTVTNDKPLPASAGDSYLTVLEDIMGLSEWYDEETEKLLSKFRSERDLGYAGDETAAGRALELALQIGRRSPELQFTMSREIAQMERQIPASNP